MQFVRKGDQPPTSILPSPFAATADNECLHNPDTRPFAEEVSLLCRSVVFSTFHACFYHAFFSQAVLKQMQYHCDVASLTRLPSLFVRTFASATRMLTWSDRISHAENKACNVFSDCLPAILQKQLKAEGSGSEAAAMTNFRQNDDSPSEVYAKQPSLQSGCTSSAVETSQPSGQGHIITTAQDEQAAFFPPPFYSRHDNQIDPSQVS